VESACVKLSESIDGLHFMENIQSVDRTSLLYAILIANSLEESTYTSLSWQNLQMALTGATAVYENAAAQQAEIDHALTVLGNALMGLTEGTAGAGQEAYIDVFFRSHENSWYYDAVYDLTEADILTGYSPENIVFGVGDPMTRADFVTLLWRLAEPDAYAGYVQSGAVNSTAFTDVEDGAYYTEAIAWALDAGIITGYVSEGEEIFNPDGYMHFDQMIAMLSRMAIGAEAAGDWDAGSLSAPRFTDADGVSDWAAGAMAWAVDAGIVTGHDNGDGTYTLASRSHVARERVVTVLWRALSNGLIEMA
ncbi:MAG: S-layer homology domain-containing protein, partial [Eggerthellaceae bacterium]|nr:S-layer homology domain-containing protein [Eggerthellaceae bacterium]